jgi:hypothetical protein
MLKVLLAGCIASVLLLVPTSASAATVQMRLPLNQTFFNPCTGDTITFTGTINLVTGVTADGSGGFHVLFADNVSDVTGIGVPSGIVYQGVGGDWFETNVKPPFPAEFTATDVINFLSAGAAPNFVANDTIHFTVNANGTITAQVVRFSLTCK